MAEILTVSRKSHLPIETLYSCISIQTVFSPGEQGRTPEMIFCSFVNAEYSSEMLHWCEKRL